MTNLNESIHFREITLQNPEDVCRRALCEYDSVKKSYALSVWGDEYVINPYEEKIERVTDNFPPPHEYLCLFIMHYLLKSRETNLLTEWISVKDIPGGATFFRGPHEIPTSLISSRPGNNVKKFKKACEKLGGVSINMADAAYVFKITPRIPAALLYWEGDDEFTAESKILFDKSVSEHLALDIIFALAVDICSRIAKAAKKTG